MSKMRQAISNDEARVGLLAREFMIGAFSAVGGDAVARELHSVPVQHIAHEMGIEMEANILFPMTFLVLIIVVRLPVMIVQKLRVSKRTRRVHHTIRRSNYVA